jgi:phosphate transport system permease protein
VTSPASTARPFAPRRFSWASFFGAGLTRVATYLIMAILCAIVGNILYQGWPNLSWRFVTSGIEEGMFNVGRSGVLPMIVGTASRVILMTIFVVPIGVITAIYITEYAHTTSPLIRLIRGAVNNLAGVPSVVFGLFGLGFFISFVGKNMDAIFNPNSAQPIWGKGALLWASLTLAVMTLPVVIVATEEALKAIPQGLREGSLALGATKLQTIVRIVLPQAMPGILTGGILAVSRAAGEVAPIIFTGAAYSIRGLPTALSDQFMDLGYHVYILSTQSPNIDQTRPLLQATVLVLLILTFALNILAILIRSQMRKKMRLLH